MQETLAEESVETGFSQCIRDDEARYLLWHFLSSCLLASIVGIISEFCAFQSEGLLSESPLLEPVFAVS